MPVKAYSSGMQLRLGFSIVAHLDADVMLIDEILAVGDESFQRKCMARIAERMAAGTTLVLVSHDPSRDRAHLPPRGGAGRRHAWPSTATTADGLLFYHRLLGTGEGRVARRCGRTRPSGAQLEIAELELVDAGGRPRAAFRTGEELGVRMSVRALGAGRAGGGGARGPRPARRACASAPTRRSASSAARPAVSFASRA